MPDLTDRQRVERAERARKAIEEFVGPEFGFARQRYIDRIAEVASTELNPTLRADKITTLSIAVRVLDEVQNGIALVMKEGESARDQIIRAERIEKLTDPQQRLIRLAGY